MFFHGGENYAAFDVHNQDDAETYSSLAAAKREFTFRAEGNDRKFPCIEGPEAWVFFGANVVGEEYPDMTFHLGPRGGLIGNKCS